MSVPWLSAAFKWVLVESDVGLIAQKVMGLAGLGSWGRDPRHLKFNAGPGGRAVHRCSKGRCVEGEGLHGRAQIVASQAGYGWEDTAQRTAQLAGRLYFVSYCVSSVLPGRAFIGLKALCTRVDQQFRSQASDHPC